MNARDRANQTLSFRRVQDRGSVLETFQPWTLTVDRFLQQGLPPEIGEPLSSSPVIRPVGGNMSEINKYFPAEWGNPVFDYEAWLGFDPLRRVSFVLPFRNLPEQIMQEDSESLIKRNQAGQVIKISKHSGKHERIRPAICDINDWLLLKSRSEEVAETCFTQAHIAQAYGGLKAGHDQGAYSLRLNIEGFFWIPRELLGIEAHLYAFYDQPELLHAINQTVLTLYIEKLTYLLQLIPVDVIYIMEDLSGKNGPMISPQFFDEFISDYYRQLIPVLKKNGVRHVFVDTDGDFSSLIPNFLQSGIEGFLPLDVNAGIDIVKLRHEYPQIKLIGGFNKLCLVEGRDAIEREFERILPIIRQGGYIPGNDHQVAPATTITNYRFYIDCLKAAMRESGRDA